MGNLLGAPITKKETHRGLTTKEKLQYGVSSMQGWRVHMEDAHICQPELYAEERIIESDGSIEEDSNSNSDTENGKKKKVKIGKKKNSKKAKNNSSSSPQSGYQRIQLPGHALFAVFDGHGGSFAANYSGSNMCRILSRQRMFVKYARYVEEQQTKRGIFSSSSVTPQERAKRNREGQECLEIALRDAFVEMDKEIMREVLGVGNECSDMPYGNDKMNNNSQTSSDVTKEGKDSGNLSTQKNIPNDEEDSGTTAVVVLVTPQWIVCANAGDSRAIYSKNKHHPVPLSYDHKPDDEAEERRIKDGGGFVSNGRVEGDLAVSRGLGDFRFKVRDTVLAGISCYYNSDSKPSTDMTNIIPDDQKVSSVPDIIVQNRNADQDEFIIVACDGIWDVQSNKECTEMVASIFKGGESDIGLICEEVLDVCLLKGSKDNMTTLIVKMKAQKNGKGGGVKQRRQLREQAIQKQEEEKKKKMAKNNHNSS